MNILKLVSVDMPHMYCWNLCTTNSQHVMPDRLCVQTGTDVKHIRLHKLSRHKPVSIIQKYRFM